MTLLILATASIGDHVVAQTPTQEPLPIPEPPLVVNGDALTEGERARFLTKLAEITERSWPSLLWSTATVASGKSMLKLIDDQYGYDDTTDHLTAFAIANLIKTANGSRHQPFEGRSNLARASSTSKALHAHLHVGSPGGAYQHFRQTA